MSSAPPSFYWLFAIGAKMLFVYIPAQFVVEINSFCSFSLHKKVFAATINMSSEDYSTDSSGKSLFCTFYFLCLFANVIIFHFNYCIVSYFISTDAEYEYSSDSGYSADGSVYSLDPVVFSPVIIVERVPIRYATPIYPTIPATSIQRTEFPSHPTSSSATLSTTHRLIKWSLPPPPVTAALLPGWTPMP